MSHELDTLAGESGAVGPRRVDKAAGPLLLDKGGSLGRYLVLERLGMGGMGVVYAAYDPQLDRKVAIKLVRPEAFSVGTSGDVRARLLREAQAMAKLSHPNVVTVHDVGTVDEQIFVAMEFIDGHSLREWLEAAPRGWPEVLATLRAAGRGLAAAHARGLIHRDFKPDNVMIARDGRVVVMDFGLVRAASPPDRKEEDGGEDEEASSTDSGLIPTVPHRPLDSALTEMGSLLGTPAYMAPEQYSGVEADARSDQFSFCVTLYEALYGQRPYPGKTTAQLAASYVEGELRPEPRASMVPRWLRVVVVRGLATMPSQRYPSMEELLAALARDPSRRRRLTRAILAGVALIAAVMGGASWMGQRRAEAVARSCEAAGAEMEAVWNDDARAGLRAALEHTGSPYAGTSYERAASWIDPWTARWAEERREVCRRAKIDQSLSEDLHAQAMACFDEQRELLAATLEVFDDANAKMVAGAAKAAASFASLESCADERTLARRLVTPPALADDPRLDRVRRDLARASALASGGDVTRAYALAREAQELAAELSWPPLEAQARLAAAGIHSELGDYEEVLAELRSAYRLAIASGSDAIAARAAIMLLRVLGYHLARSPEALVWAEVAQALLERLDASESLDAAQLANNTALAQDVAGDYKTATRWHHRALDLRRQVLTEDHPETGHSLGNLGNMAMRRGELAEGLDWHLRALAVRTKGLGPGHPDVARSHANTGRAYLALGRHDEALRHFRESLEILDGTLGLRHRVAGRIHDNIGKVHLARGEHELALEQFERALDIQLEVLGPHHHETAQTTLDMGLALLGQGRLGEADARVREAAQSFEAGLGAEHPFLAQVNEALARLCRAQHEPACPPAP